MNQKAVSYWNSQALASVYPEIGKIRQDNFHKRRAEIARLMEDNFYKKSVLEIGIGNGVVAGVIKGIYWDSVNYQATELSNVFIEFCQSAHGIEVKQADVTELPFPDRAFDYILALDSLEHVRPEEREKGNYEISRVMKKRSKLIINMPLTPSVHDDQFDHPFTMTDVGNLRNQIKADLKSYNEYTIHYENGITPTSYAWIVMERNL